MRGVASPGAGFPVWLRSWLPGSAGAGLNRMRTLIEDDDLLIRYLPGTDARLTVAFTGVGRGLGGIQRDEFVRSAADGGASHALFVTDRRRSWYARTGLAARIIAAVQEIVARRGIARVATLGNSMGGFGALWFADRLGATVAMAFAPQASTDPAVLPEPRWAQFRAQMDPAGIRTVDAVPGSACLRFAVFGARQRLDRPHADLIEARTGAQVYRLAEAGHGVARYLKERGQLAPLVAEMLAGDIAAVRARLLPLTRGMQA